MHRRLAAAAGITSLVLLGLFAGLDLDAAAGGPELLPTLRSLLLLLILVGSNVYISWTFSTARARRTARFDDELVRRVDEAVAARVDAAIAEVLRAGMVLGAEQTVRTSVGARTSLVTVRNVGD